MISLSQIFVATLRSTNWNVQGGRSDYRRVASTSIVLFESFRPRYIGAMKMAH